MSNATKLPATVRRRRNAMGLTQTALAERIGWHRSQVCRLEAGYVTNPTRETLRKVAKALGVKVGELV